MKLFNLLKFIVVVIFMSIITMACLWDNDTIEMETQQFPGTFELITGKFLRHSDEFHEWRIKDRLKRIRQNPDSINYYNDLAVSYSKLKRDKEAIKVMQKVEKIAPGRYETYANMGTFYIHDGELKKGIEYIDKALTINPEAHFGRERYQKYLAEYLLTKKKEGKIELPLSKNRSHDFRDFLLEKYNFNNNKKEKTLPISEMKSAQKSIEGMMKFGNYDSPILLEVLADILTISFEDESTPRHLVALCYFNASKQSKNENALKRYIEKGNNIVDQIQVDGENWQTNRKKIVNDFNKGGIEFFQKIRQNELDWIADPTKNPEVEFAKLYYKKDVSNQFPDDKQIPTTEVVLDSSIVNNNADTLDIEQIVEDTKDQPSLYDYNQLFMFGFLVLGAILVVWKFSGKGKY